MTLTGIRKDCLAGLPSLKTLKENLGELSNRNEYNNNPIIRSLAFMGRRLTIPEKTVVFQEGRSCDNVYFLMRGLVKLSTYLPNGNARVVRICSSGTFFGLEATHRQKYLFYASALTDCELVTISKQDLITLKQKEPANYCSLLESQFDLEQINDKLHAEFSIGSVQARVARLLCYLIALEPGKETFSLVCCDDIAAMVGATIESVSRVLAEFKRSAIIRLANSAQPARYHYKLDDLLLCSLDDKQVYKKPMKKEKRQHRRGFLNTSADVFVEGEFVGTGTITDYSRNGLFLRLGSDVQVQRTGDLLLKLRNRSPKRISKELNGQVARQEQSGVGISLKKSAIV